MHYYSLKVYRFSFEFNEVIRLAGPLSKVSVAISAEDSCRIIISLPVISQTIKQKIEFPLINWADFKKV